MRYVVFQVGACLLLSACAYYPSRHLPDECAEDADCNIGRTCGELVRCVEGQCDRQQTYQVPCTVRCSDDSECVLADKGCCCGFGTDDYVAIPAANLEQWNNRDECGDVECAYPECDPPAGIWPVCREGQCLIEYDQNLFDVCTQDQDCKKVPSGCTSCRCGDGYEEKAINRDYESAYLQQLEKECALAGQCAPGPYGAPACTDRPPECRRGRCQVLGQDCNCPMLWDPVCAQSPAGGHISLPNQCQADCLGFAWDYRGRCECEAACLDPDPVCASNGLTYWCGAQEARCSGHRIRYPGYCDPACDYCEETIVEEAPVCGVDFVSYLDACYAECHGVSWWHAGDCLEGEGADCDAGTSPVPCPLEELYCLPDGDCPDCPGCACPATCILLGACRNAADCRRQPLTPGECNGRWLCQEHTCTWSCG